MHAVQPLSRLWLARVVGSKPGCIPVSGASPVLYRCLGKAEQLTRKRWLSTKFAATLREDVPCRRKVYSGNEDAGDHTVFVRFVAIVDAIHVDGTAYEKEN